MIFTKKFFLHVFFILFPIISYAESGMCYRSSEGDANAWHYDFGNISMTTTDNAAGVVKNNIASFNMTGDAKLWCDCSTGSNLLFSSSLNMPSDGDGWFKLNQYLGAKLEININGVYKPIPYNDLKTGVSSGTYCHQQKIIGGTPTGGIGRLSIKVDKPFVGQVFIPQQVIAQECITSGVSGVACTQNKAAYTYTFSGSLTVPQNCQINSGSNIVVDLGDISRGKFKYAGQKPEGFNPATFSVPIQCNDSSALANLTLRIQGNPATNFPEAIQSDNNDIGVVIADSTGNALKPNVMDSNVSFLLDGSYRSSVVLHAYPISTSGNQPGLGLFTSMAYLRVDFE